MRIVCQTFSLPKEGREFSDYEDACFPSSPIDVAAHVEEHKKTEIFRTAVADGATDSCFSKYWAQLLAAGYGSGEWAEDIDARALVPAQTSWQKYVDQQDLPWYAEEKVKLGAFAAFVGLTLVDSDCAWRAVAIGDCCLFHTRAGELISCFPLTQAADFNNFPYLLGSLKDRNDGVFDEKQTKVDGRWVSGDIFLLMSDALACWFLRCAEGGAGAQLIAWLTELDNHELFKQLVASQRTQMGAGQIPNMKDDDVTLVKIWVGDDQAAPPVVQSKSQPQVKKLMQELRPEPETVRLAAQPKGPAPEAADATISLTRPANIVKKDAKAGTTPDAASKLAGQVLEKPPSEQPTLRYMPAQARGKDEAGQGDDDKPGRRATSERAAQRQTRNDQPLAPEIGPSDEGQPGSRPNRAGSGEPWAESMAPSRGGLKKSGAGNNQRTLLIGACLVVMVSLAGIAFFMKNQAQRAPASQPAAAGQKSGGAARVKSSQGSAANSAGTKEAGDEAAPPPESGGAGKNQDPNRPAGAKSAKKARLHSHQAQALHVPIDDLPANGEKGLDLLPDNKDKSIKFQKANGGDLQGQPKLEQ